MKHPIPLALISLSALLPASADLLINEVRIDNSGTNDIEYFELFNNGASPVSLAGLSFLTIGDGTGGSGVIEQVTSFTTGSVPAGGWFVVADTGAGSLAGVDSDGDGSTDLVVTPDLVSALNFENSDNLTHLLVQGFSGANGDDLDTDNDGVLDVTPWSSVLDAVGMVEEANPPTGTEFSYGTSLGFVDLGPDRTFVPGHVFRNANGSAWAIGVFGTEGSTAGVIAASDTPILDSPGSSNPAVGTGSLSLSLSTNPISESAGGSATTLTVTRLGNTTGDLTVTLFLDDPSEAALQGTELLLFDGLSSATIDIDAVNDLWPDGDQTVTITATAPNFGSAETTLTVADDSDPSGLVINEVYYTPNPLDANGNGTTGFEDAFVEIVNSGASPLDLSFYTLRENGYGFRGEVHAFPAGTTLAPGAALVVFGGGNIAPGTTAAFGSAEVQLASSGGLFLSNDGDQLSLRDLADAEVAGLTLPDVTTTPDAGSLTLATDASLGSGYIRHTATTAGTPFSPGTKIDASAFATVSQMLSMSVATPTVVENAGNVSMALTVTLPAPATRDTIIRFSSSDPGELLVQDSVTIGVGATSVSIDVLAVDDSEVDGDQPVTVSAISSGYLNASGVITVGDDGSDVPVFTDLVINEFDANQPGTDSAEFVELYNKTSSTQSLDGLVLVFFNGSGDIIYRAIDLSGQTIPANGYFVIGNAGVPSATIPLPTNGLQNGPDAIALYKGSLADYPNNAGVAGLPGTLVDAVVYAGADAELQAALDPSGISVPEPDAADTAAARATDGGSAFGSAAFVNQTPTPGATNVLPLNNFSTWATANGVLEGPDGDDDDDRIENLVEYALGLDPKVPDSLADTFDGTTLRFTKGAEALANGDLTYTIQVSDDLGATDPWEAATPDATPADVIAYTLPPGAGALFARLLVTQN